MSSNMYPSILGFLVGIFTFSKWKIKSSKFFRPQGNRHCWLDYNWARIQFGRVYFGVFSTSLTGGPNWLPLVQKRNVTNRGAPTDLFWSKNLTSLRGAPNDLLDVWYNTNLAFLSQMPKTLPCLHFSVIYWSKISDKLCTPRISIATCRLNFDATDLPNS